MLHTKIIQTYACILMIVWVVFLFHDKHTIAQGYPDIYEENIIHSGAPVTSGDQIEDSQSQMPQIISQDYNEKQSNLILMKQLYTQNPNADVLINLIGALLQQHRFDEAYSYVQEAIKNYPGALDPHTHIYATFHAPSIVISQDASIGLVSNTINAYREKNLISSDDYTFYQAMIAFWYNNFSDAKMLLTQIQSPKYSAIQSSLLETFANSEKQKGIPAYYGDAVIALTLMKNGYYSIAKKIATNTVLQNSSYILPYQILAYSHFMTQNRDTAIEYLLLLRNLESKQAQRYIFLIGVSHYRKGDYTQSILYLNQVTAAGLVIDAYRYMFLSYVQGGEYGRAHATRQKLLGNTSIMKNDFYSYFYTVFYEPIRHQQDWSMYRQNPTTVSASIQQCFVLLGSGDHDICAYGNAGLAMINDNNEEAKTILEDLIARYNAPYLLHAMGDYYANTADQDSAETYYMQALSLSNDRKEQSILQRKIIELR